MLEKITFFKKIFDTVWEYHRDSGQLYVHYDSALPEYCNRQLPYEEMYNLYVDEYVYKDQ